jgi:putative membrane protein
MRSTAALVLLSCATWACASGGSEAAERSEDTAGRRDSIAAVAAASMSEANVLGLLEQTHGADSALGALGAARGSTSDVKDFGRMILREHHALRKDALDVAQRLGITPETPRVAPDEAPTEMRDSLLTAAMSGLSWDRAYIDYAIAVHQSALENTARALAATQHAEVKELISKSVPILQKHIDKATRLTKTLTTTQTAARPDSLRREKAKNDSLRREARRDSLNRSKTKAPKR